MRLATPTTWNSCPSTVRILPSGIGVGEQLVGDVGADHANHVAMLVVAIGDVAAGRDLFHVHVADVGGHAAQVDIFQVLPLGCARWLSRRTSTPTALGSFRLSRNAS